MTVEIIHADARSALAAMPEGSVHTCVTSPPYWGLRDYGLPPTVWGDGDCEHEWGAELPGDPRGGSGPGAKEKDTYARQVARGNVCRRCNAWRGTLGLEPTPELYVEHIVQVMREVRRVLRDDGTLWLNLGDSYAAGGNGARDPERWPKQSRNADGFRSVHSKKRGGLKPKDLCGMPWRVAFALQSDGWWLRSDIIWSKPNPMPESVRDRPTRAHEYLFLLSKRARYFYDADAIREPMAESSVARISQPTFDQQTGGPKDYAKTGVNRHRSARKALEGLKKRDKQRGHGRRHDGFNDRWDQMTKEEQQSMGANKRTVWEIATQAYPEAHFAVFPEKLVEPCILAGTSERGCCPECGAPWERVVEKELIPTQATNNPPVAAPRGPLGDQAANRLDAGHRRGYQAVTTTGWRPTCDHEGDPTPCTALDPFAGSGTVGVVAERLGRHSVLIDAKEEYCQMARHRTAQRGLMAKAAAS